MNVITYDRLGNIIQTRIIETDPEPISVSEFLRRFTRQERIAIRQAKNTDSVIEDFLHLINIAASETGTVRLDHPDLIEGANYLESKGFIAPGRAAQLLEK